MQSFSLVQVKFNMYDQNEYNNIVHWFTTFGIFYSLFGLIHKNIINLTSHTIVKVIGISIVFCSALIDSEKKNTIVFFSVLFLYNCIFMMLFLDKYLNSYKYSVVFISSILVQELSHIFFDEEAMMYHYDGIFLEDFLTHGMYIVPLMVQLFIE